MPLQNRVDPFGELIVTPARGTFMGNRGGRIHIDGKKLTARRWASKQWICCVLEFKDRQRDVWGKYYTELFFLDEVTALAAGHRPCFECRRKDAKAFAAYWQKALRLKRQLRASEMDEALQTERLNGRTKRMHQMKIDTLPNGAMMTMGGEAFAVRGNKLLHWTMKGYDEQKSRPRAMAVGVLTPPSIVKVLRAGYEPAWHPSAETV